MSEMKKILLSAFATSALLLAGCSDNGDEVASTEAGRGYAGDYSQNI